MNRGNRRIIVASIVLTLPLAILLGSFSTGAPPYKAAHRSSDSASKHQAAPSNLAASAAKAANRLLGMGKGQPTAPKARRGVSTKRTNPVQQVAHQQDETASQLTGGILHAFSNGPTKTANSGQRTAHAHTHAHAKSAVVPTAGVLDGLVDAIKPARKSSQSNRRSVAQQQPTKRPAANWDGIPFHSPNRDTAALKRAPIRDPNQATTRLSAVRQPAQAAPAPPVPRVSVAAATPKRTIQARPVSSRIGGGTSILQRAPAVSDVRPRLAVDSKRAVTKAPSSSQEYRDQPALSSTESSRRSGRRSIGALDPSEIAAASTTPDAIASDDLLDTQLVPKASRRMIVDAAKSQAKKITEKVSESTTTLAKTAKQELAAIESKVAVAVKKPVPTAEVEMKPQSKPEATKAPSAVQALAKPNNVAELSAPTLAAPAAAKLKKPAPLTIETAPAKLAAVPAPIPAPVEKLAPLPTAKLSAPAVAATSPSVANTSPALKVQSPSASVAHRANVQRTGPPATAFEQPATVAPKFVPIGSGVLNAGDNEALPAARVAQAPRAYGNSRETNSYNNSYRSESHSSGTYTNDPYAPQPYFDANAQPAPQVTRPMRAAPAVTQQAESNFQARSSTAVANEMRPSVQAPVAAAKPVDRSNSRVASELPGIRVVTHGPKQIMIRQTHQFEIRVENRGSIDAEGVLVRAMIPDWAEVRGQNASTGSILPENQKGSERLAWTIDQLPAGTSETMFVRLKAERSGTHGLDVDWTLMPQKSVTKIEVREPRLELTIEGPEEVVFGQSQTYRVRVLNPGDGVAPNVVFTLSPNSPTPQTQRIGDIPPGKEAQFEVELTAQDLGDLKIAGLASGGLELRAEAAKTIRVSAAKLEAMLTGPELKYQDSEANYNLEIANKGIATSEKITATLRLPAGAKYISGLDKAVQRGSTLTWQVDSLPPTAVRNYKFQCMMKTTGEQMFAFDCKGSAAGQANVSLVTRVESIADLVMTINDPAAPAPVGDDVTYEIVIRNRGSKAATDVRAIAQFSHGIEPRRVEGQSGELLTGQVLFDPIEKISAGEEIRLKVVANAARPGHHRFRSEIRSGDTILVAEEATHYMNPKSDRVSRRSSETMTR